MTYFKTEFFVKNRERLMQVLPNSLVILPANCLLQESADLSFPFRQDSSFWYLTGLERPDVLLVIDTARAEVILLVHEQNDYQKEWEGEVGRHEIKKKSGISQIRDRTELSKIVKDAKKRKLQICHLEPLPKRVEPYGFYANPARQILHDELIEQGIELHDVRMDISRLRQNKQPEEVLAIQEAIRITGESLAAIKPRLSEFKTEKELERAITAEFFARGADGHAYQPIVASGKNAAIIHYEANPENVIEDNALLLLDVGAKVQGYAADISRTWAVGTCTDRQKIIFDATLKLQDKAFSMIKVGTDIKQYQKTMEAEVAKVLKRLGIAKRQYPHGFSHFLGLDVHDAGDYSSPLAKNSVITVEPGLYFPEENIGVRIEDNVLLTEEGIVNLSSGIPRML